MLTDVQWEPAAAAAETE